MNQIMWNCRKCGAANDNSLKKCGNEECLLVRDGTEPTWVFDKACKENEPVMVTVPHFVLEEIVTLAGQIANPESHYNNDPLAMANEVIAGQVNKASDIAELIDGVINPL